MSTKEILKLIGLIFVGGAAALEMFRFLLTKIAEVDDRHGKAIADVRERYARKDDLLQHINRLRSDDA